MVAGTFSRLLVTLRFTLGLPQTNMATPPGRSATQDPHQSTEQHAGHWPPAVAAASVMHREGGICPRKHPQPLMPPLPCEQKHKKKAVSAVPHGTNTKKAVRTVRLHDACAE